MTSSRESNQETPPSRLDGYTPPVTEAYKESRPTMAPTLFYFAPTTSTADGTTNNNGSGLFSPAPSPVPVASSRPGIGWGQQQQPQQQPRDHQGQTSSSTMTHPPEQNMVVVSILIVLIIILCMILAFVTIPPFLHMIRRKLPVPKARIQRRYDTIDGWLVTKRVQPHDDVCDCIQHRYCKKTKTKTTEKNESEETAMENKTSVQVKDGTDIKPKKALTLTAAILVQKLSPAGPDDEDDKHPSKDSTIKSLVTKTNSTEKVEERDISTTPDDIENQKQPQRQQQQQDDDQSMSSSSTSSDMDGPECSICLETFRVHDKVSWSTNPHCGHVFHHNCIREWLLRRVGCPCCRKVLLPVDRPLLQPSRTVSTPTSTSTPAAAQDVENAAPTDGDVSSTPTLAAETAAQDVENVAPTDGALTDAAINLGEPSSADDTAGNTGEFNMNIPTTTIALGTSETEAPAVRQSSSPGRLRRRRRRQRQQSHSSKDQKRISNQMLQRYTKERAKRTTTTYYCIQDGLVTLHGFGLLDASRSKTETETKTKTKRKDKPQQMDHHLSPMIDKAENNNVVHDGDDDVHHHDDDNHNHDDSGTRRNFLRLGTPVEWWESMRRTTIPALLRRYGIFARSETNGTAISDFSGQDRGPNQTFLQDDGDDEDEGDMEQSSRLELSRGRSEDSIEVIFGRASTAEEEELEEVEEEEAREEGTPVDPQLLIMQDGEEMNPPPAVTAEDLVAELSSILAMEQ